MNKRLFAGVLVTLVLAFFMTIYRWVQVYNYRDCVTSGHAVQEPCARIMDKWP